ncbi:MAG: glycosyltransferase family 1 protein [Candidatus Peregrinibacteria bacterium]
MSFHLAIDARMYSSRFTGIGRYVHEISKRIFQARPDWKVSFFLSPPEYQSFVPPHANVFPILAPEPIYSLAEQTSFPFKILKESPDLTWFPHFNVPVWYPKKFVVTIHDLTISRYPGKKKTSILHKYGYQAILKNALLRSQKIFAVSQNTKKDLMEMEGVSDKKIRVIHNGIGEEFLSPLQNLPIAKTLEKYEIQKPFFLYTGVWREHKNILRLLQAFQSLVTEGIVAELVLTGNPDPYYPEILEYIHQNHLENLVKTVGLVNEDELLSLYSSATAYVFPSLYEGFGLPGLEAMALGTPVLSSSSSCLPEIYGDGAEFFNPENTEEMAQKMKSVLESPDLRNSLQERGKIQVQKFSWDRAAKAVQEEMENIFAPKK